MRAVQFDSYGDRSVLYVADVPEPEAAPGRVLVQIYTAGINPGEAGIRSGALHERFTASFPSGEGSDLAGVVTAVGEDVDGFAVGDEVLGWSWERSSHAEFAAVPAEQLIHKPAGLGWLQAGALYVAGATAWAAAQAVEAKAGEVVAVSAAAGGVGSLVVQLLKRNGVTVIGIASASNHDWLRSKGVIPVAYGDALEQDIRDAAPAGVDAFVDLFGPEYLDLAVKLGVPVERIETIISFEQAGKIGAKAEGSMEGSKPEVLTELAELISSGEVEFPVAETFPLERVTDAFELLEQRHTRGKIVLVTDAGAATLKAGAA